MRRKISENLKRVEQRIEQACLRAGRKPESVTLVAVTKYATIDIIRSMVDLGFENLGESRVQELTKRAAAVSEWLSRKPRSPGALTRPHWHMVGHLQRNKVKAILPWIDMIHSVDSLRLAEEIDARAGKLDRRIPILLQVNAAEEPGKAGVAVAATSHLAEQIITLPHLEVRGLMALAPATEDTEVIRRVFERVREVFDEMVGERVGGPEFRELSLGMSHDLEYGIAAGATYVRIGSALFEGIPMRAEPVPAE